MEDESIQDGTDTALIPKSMFGDKAPEVGKTCKFKIEHIFEDDVEVSYVSSDKKKDQPEPESDYPSMAQQIDEAAI